jgi:hypothetical protein
LQGYRLKVLLIYTPQYFKDFNHKIGDFFHLKLKMVIAKNSKNTEGGVRGFNYDLDFENTDFRQHPELYRVGRGEQGVLLVQPYKSEILPYWRFKTEDIARVSAEKIYALFENYLQKEDFVGADMARKFLQMGFTRARRYANYKGGKKYEITEGDTNAHKSYPYSSGSPHKGNALNALQADALTNEKARAAAVFKGYWFKAKAHDAYLAQKSRFLAI